MPGAGSGTAALQECEGAVERVHAGGHHVDDDKDDKDDDGSSGGKKSSSSSSGGATVTPQPAPVTTVEGCAQGSSSAGGPSRAAS